MDPSTTQEFISSCSKGNLTAVTSFLAEGHPVNAANEVGYTPLMAAARSCRIDLVAFLLESDADIHRRDMDGLTALHHAFGESSTTPEKQAECGRLILNQGADVNASDKSGITPLMTAAWFNCLPGVHHLLSRGAIASQRDDRGRTAGDVAFERRNTEIAELLNNQMGQ